MKNPVLDWWHRLRNIPLGRFIFARIIALRVPYTGTVSPLVEVLTPTHTRVSMKDRRRVRNHFDCIHAVAQMNLAEFATGLALTAQLTGKARFIIVSLSMTYVKKARGRLVAECRCDAIETGGSPDISLTSELRDGGGEVVARAVATWRVTPLAPAGERSRPAA